VRGGPLDPTSYDVGYILSPRHVGADLINELLTQHPSKHDERLKNHLGFILCRILMPQGW
jgi:hypothetical protein